MRNGGAVRATFVAELGSDEAPAGRAADLGGEYWGRATCTRCVPRWYGPIRKLTTELGRHPGATPAEALAVVRDQLRRDVLAHCDRRHAGRLRG